MSLGWWVALMLYLLGMGLTAMFLSDAPRNERWRTLLGIALWPLLAAVMLGVLGVMTWRFVRDTREEREDGE